MQLADSVNLTIATQDLIKMREKLIVAYYDSFKSYTTLPKWAQNLEKTLMEACQSDPGLRIIKNAAYCRAFPNNRGMNVPDFIAKITNEELLAIWISLNRNEEKWNAKDPFDWVMDYTTNPYDTPVTQGWETVSYKEWFDMIGEEVYVRGLEL